MHAQQHGPACARCGGRLFTASSRFCTRCGLSQVGIKLEAHELQKSVRDRASRQRKYLLNNINLVINPGEFVGVLGASGSGKSTLVDALSGRRPVNGAVLYNRIDLYRSAGSLKSAIGYVPQQDIVHRRITVERALTYTALLRLPVTTSLSAVDERIRLVLRRVELADKLRQSIDTPVPLSGGQLKRVNLATELVPDPKILFLDEPTSGLDPGLEEGLMGLFALLAREGRTVICVTHTLTEIQTCDLIAVLHAGALVFFGPPSELCQYFRLRRVTDVYKTLGSYNAQRLAERYQKSELYDEFVVRRVEGNAARAESALVAADVGKTVSDRKPLNWRQAKILTRRYVDLMAADKRTLALLLLQAPIIGLVMGSVFSPNGSLAERFRVDRQVMFTMVMSAIWLGCLNSAREIVKELPIYLRERAVNLDVGSYLLSKLLPLSALCAVQCVTLLVIVSYMVPIPGSIVERGIVLFLTALAATSMGLMVSALVSSTDKAIATIPLLLIPQMILSDVSIKLEHVSRTVAKASIIAFWGFNAIKQTLPADVSACPPDWSTGNFWHGVGMLTVFFFMFLGGAAVGLKLKDRHAFRPPPNRLMQGLKLAGAVSLPVIAFLFLYLGPERQRLVDFWHDLNPSRSTESASPSPVAKSTTAAGGMPGSGEVAPPNAIAGSPRIESVTAISAQPNQEIVISGTGFGSIPPFNGNSVYLRIRDISRRWIAGWNGSLVHLNVAKWIDTQIVISGFTGSYGAFFWSLRPGDQVALEIWNPQTSLGPATYNATVSEAESSSGYVVPSPSEGAGGKVWQLEVPAVQPWTRTEISVNAGAAVSISASGTIYVGRLRNAEPQGQPWPACPNGGMWGAYVAPGLPCWSLIGRIGDNGIPFEVGSNATVKAPVSGPLYLGVNDNYFPDNRGQWNVRVSLNPAN